MVECLRSIGRVDDAKPIGGGQGGMREGKPHLTGGR
jgi:hypothetical protein